MYFSTLLATFTLHIFAAVLPHVNNNRKPTMTLKLVLTTFTVALTFSSPYLVQAREASDTSLDSASAAAEIREFLAGQEKANAQGMSASDLAKRFYMPDVTITGEGEAQAKRGMEAAVTALQDWNDYLGPGGQKGCHFTMQEPVVSAGDMASAYAVLSCAPNPPKLEKGETIRQLFVFKRTSAGWRVAQEMWQAGGY
ncbi:UNVERIFIED_ORG: hypothetical protein J2Y84_002895 [Pseudomonas reinekei]